MNSSCSSGNGDGPRSLTPYAWMLCGCFAFAWMSEFAYRLGQQCEWRIVALARSFLAFFFAYCLARLSGAPLVFRGSKVLWLRSCAGSLSLLCTFFALTRLRTGEVLALTNTFPIWVAILSWPLLKIRPSMSVWVAALCGVAGIMLIRRPSFEMVEGAQLAVFLSLTAALTSALAMLGLNQLKNLHPWAIVVHFSGVATIFVLFTWCIGPSPDLRPVMNPEAISLLLGVGATATVGQMCLTRAFTLGQPAKVSVVGLTQILFAMTLDWFAGRPAFDPSTLLGIGLVISPTAWVMLERARKPAEVGPEPRPATVATPSLTMGLGGALSSTTRPNPAISPASPSR